MVDGVRFVCDDCGKSWYDVIRVRMSALVEFKKAYYDEGPRSSDEVQQTDDAKWEEISTPTILEDVKKEKGTNEQLLMKC